MVFVWGGDGMVQRCVDALAGSEAAVAILPAGTANLLANNLEIPADLRAAVEIGLRGPRHRLDLGQLNGEHFAVMAGAGFDAEMIRDADRSLKKRVGRMAYVWTGLRHVRDGAVPTKVRIDGATWFDGMASCVLVANVGKIAGGIPAFDDARPDDGWLDVGVVDRGRSAAMGPDPGADDRGPLRPLAVRAHHPGESGRRQARRLDDLRARRRRPRHQHAAQGAHRPGGDNRVHPP